MSEFYLKSPYVVLGGTDVSAYVMGVTLNVGREKLDNTKGGTDTRTSMMGLKIWDAKIQFAADLADGLLDEILWTLLDAGAAFAVIIAALGTGETASNPEYTGNMIFDGPYNVLGGAVGEHQTNDVALAAAGAITRDIA